MAKPSIILVATPDGEGTSVDLEVFDLAAAVGQRSVYQFQFSSLRRPETRPEWYAVYAHRILRELLAALLIEIDDYGPSMSAAGHTPQDAPIRHGRLERDLPWGFHSQ